LAGAAAVALWRTCEKKKLGGVITIRHSTCHTETRDSRTLLGKRAKCKHLGKETEKHLVYKKKIFSLEYSFPFAVLLKSEKRKRTGSYWSTRPVVCSQMEMDPPPREFLMRI